MRLATAHPAGMLWKNVEIRGQFFHRCPAWRDQLGSNAAPGSKGAVSPSDCVWEVAPFFITVISMDAARWLESKGGHNMLGSQRIHNLAQILCPGLPVRWFPSGKWRLQMGPGAGHSSKPVMAPLRFHRSLGV